MSFLSTLGEACHVAMRHGVVSEESTPTAPSTTASISENPNVEQAAPCEKMKNACPTRSPRPKMVRFKQTVRFKLESGGRVETEVVDDDDDQTLVSRSRDCIRSSLENELRKLSKEQERADRYRIQLMSRISLLDGLPQMLGFTDEADEDGPDDTDEKAVHNFGNGTYESAETASRMHHLELELKAARGEIERLRVLLTSSDREEGKLRSKMLQAESTHMREMAELQGELDNLRQAMKRDL